MSTRAERFRNRKKILSDLESKPFVSGVVDQEHVDAMLSSGLDQDRLARLKYDGSQLSVAHRMDQNEAKRLVLELRRDFDKNRLDSLLYQTQKDIVGAIVGPFGLGKIYSAYDKVGGSVTTVHNANQKVYARKEDEYNRQDYTNTTNSQGDKFAGSKKNSVGSRYTRSQMDDNGMVQDAYTKKWQKADTTSPDHIESLSQYHKDGGFMQSGTKKSDFATDEDNLALTDRSINQSMRDFDKTEWKEKKNSSGIKNKERFAIDDEALQSKIKKGKETASKYLPSNLEKGQYYLKRSAVTGLPAGVRMGAQQALGILMVEFFASAFTEVKSAFHKGLEGDSLYSDIKIRLVRIKKNLKSKWQDIVTGFSGGFISGFLSNLITTVINIFKTTGKRLVRMIREGAFSLLRALKLTLLPPKNMNRLEAMHEAMKLIAAGGIVIAGVVLEEVVEKLFLSVPVLAPLSTIASPIVVGSLTALGMALVAYLIDKMDLLGVIKVQQTKYVIDRLDADIESTLTHCEEISDEIDRYLVPG